MEKFGVNTSILKLNINFFYKENVNPLNSPNKSRLDITYPAIAPLHNNGNPA